MVKLQCPKGKLTKARIPLSAFFFVDTFSSSYFLYPIFIHSCPQKIQDPTRGRGPSFPRLTVYFLPEKSNHILFRFLLKMRRRKGPNRKSARNPYPETPCFGAVPFAREDRSLTCPHLYHAADFAFCAKSPACREKPTKNFPVGMLTASA